MSSEQAPERILPDAESGPGLPGLDLAGYVCRPVAPGEPSCCCSSRPAVRVVLPPTQQRDHAVDLLLCRHHFRRSSAAITRAGARCFDEVGAPLTPADPAPAAAR